MAKSAKSLGVEIREKNLKPAKPGESANKRGRPKGSISISSAYKRALAEVDPSDKAKRRSISDGIANVVASLALAGHIDAAKEIRQATEGDKSKIEGNVRVRVVYVNDWRRGASVPHEKAETE